MLQHNSSWKKLVGTQANLYIESSPQNNEQMKPASCISSTVKNVGSGIFFYRFFKPKLKHDGNEIQM